MAVVVANETLLAPVSFCQKPNILIFSPLKWDRGSYLELPKVQDSFIHTMRKVIAAVGFSYAKLEKPLRATVRSFKLTAVQRQERIN